MHIWIDHRHDADDLREPPLLCSSLFLREQVKNDAYDQNRVDEEIKRDRIVSASILYLDYYLLEEYGGWH